MRFALSNIALPAFEHEQELHAVAAFGIEGIEVAPSRVWRDTWAGLRPDDIDAYRRAVGDAGLEIVGLHSLFWDQPDLGLFRDPETRARTLDFMAHLSALCRDLGGRTLVFGSAPARRRGDLPLAEAEMEAARFFADLEPRIAGHDTCFVFEALGPSDSDFVNSVRDAKRLVDAVDSPILRMHLDAKAMVEAGEMNAEAVALALPALAHVHVNEPDLGLLGTSGRIDHVRFGSLLRDAGYGGWVSIEQRMLSNENSLADATRSIAVLRAAYATG